MDQKVLSVAVEDHAEDNNREQKSTLACDPQPAALDEFTAHNGCGAGRTNSALDFTRFLPFQPELLAGVPGPAKDSKRVFQCVFRRQSHQLVRHVAILEEDERGDGLNAKRWDRLGAFIHVDFDEFDFCSSAGPASSSNMGDSLLHGPHHVA